MITALIIFIILFLLTLSILVLVIKGSMSQEKVLKAKLEAVEADRNRVRELLRDIEISREKHETQKRKIDSSKDGNLAHMLNSLNN